MKANMCFVARYSCRFVLFVDHVFLVFVTSNIMKPIRVAFLNDSARIAGAEKSLALLVQNLPDWVNPLVVCPPGEYADFLAASGVRNVKTARVSHYNRANGYLRYMVSLVKLARILLNFGVQIIHCNSYRAGHWGIPLAYLLGLQTVCHVRDSHYTRFSTLLMKRAGNRVHFIAISNAVKEALVKVGVAPEKVSVIYNGTDVRSFRPGLQPARFLRESPVSLNLGIFGRIEERKRHIDAIEALPLIRKHADSHLYIVGDAWKESGQAVEKWLQERIVQLGLGRHVSFTGYRTDVPEIMAGVDIVLVPSVDEPMGRVILEAMASEKPVIGTLSGGIPEVIENGTSGLLVEPKAPAVLADAVLRLVRDPRLAARLAANGRERATKLFSIEAHVSQVVFFYNTILGREPSSDPDQEFTDPNVTVTSRPGTNRAPETRT